MGIVIPSLNNPTLNSMRTPTIDLSSGGQNGIMTNPQLWTSHANYVRQQIIAVLYTEPLALQFMPNAGSWLASLKALIEIMPQKIDGLQSSLSGDFDGPVVGNAGEKLESVIKGNRTPSAPVFEWSDKYGMAVTRFWTEYFRNLVIDPDLQFPGIASQPAYIAAGSPPLTPEMLTFTVLFIEPDQTMTNVTNAWLIANMAPKSGGEIIGKREKGGSNEIPTVSIEFTALQQPPGQAVFTLANNYLQTLNLGNMRPLDLYGFTDGISPNVAAVNLSGLDIAQNVSASVLPPTDTVA